MKRHRIVGIGEILWDVFPDGPRFGGAPANFACSAAGLGRRSAEVQMVSGVGQDAFGEQALVALQRRAVDSTFVQSLDLPTGTVLVQLDDQGCASYEFALETAWDHLAWSSDLEQLALRTDAVCFGTLGQRSAASREVIHRFVSATSANSLRVLDVNLRPPFVRNEDILASLELANVLKLNDDELPILGELCGVSGSATELLTAFSARFDLRLGALTRGPRGALLVRDNEVSDHAGVKVNVVDTVGAGDAFTAALILSVLDGANLEEANQTSCAVAAYVCGKSGATPELPKLDDFADA